MENSDLIAPVFFAGSGFQSLNELKLKTFVLSMTKYQLF